MRHSRIAVDTPPERRGWLSHGIAALAISALGLVVAGSMSLTTSAQPQGGGEPPAATTIAQAGERSTSASTATVDGAGGTGATTPAAQTTAADAFAARPSGVDTSRSAELRSALAKERAAQRAEGLAKTSEEVTRAVRDEASKARQTKLDAAEAQIQENAVKLAWARQQRAIAARVAAGNVVASASDATTASTEPDTSTIPTGGSAVAPVPGAVVGAHFGQYGLWSRYHTGLDFRAAYGTPIRAVLPGVVLYAGNSGDWAGNHIAIRHAGGVTTMSSHMSSMVVHAGQSVSAGQVIGYVGQTGRAFGPHLHFELYPAGVKYGDVYKAIDPQPWLRAHGLQTH
jgi:murein DD-endopeptidase MepM/ murein hydrolase activator NlpD